MRRVGVLLVVVGALVVAALAATADARGPITFNVDINHGAGGVVLGYKRATVLKKLGKPYYENANGYMQYDSTASGNLFDIYRSGGGKSSKIRTISVSDKRFVFKGTKQKVMGRGVIPYLRKHYGKRLKLGKSEDGERFYYIDGHHGKARSETSFSIGVPSRDPVVGQIFISYTG
jgi:hypothetical protein